MRIGILTLPLHTNYGGILQAYALQTVLERMGHDVEVLQFQHYYKIPKWKIIPHYIKFWIKLLLKHNVDWYYICKNTNKFIKANINIRRINSFTNINPDDYDAIIVGSDQIWREKFFKMSFGKDINMANAFLSFTKGWNIKRIAYAASFGKDDIEEYPVDELQECKESICRFNAVSVREKSGVHICKDQFGVKSEWLLDPTMLLKRNDYLNLIHATINAKSHSKLLMTYILDETPLKNDIICFIAKNRELVINKANGDVDNPTSPLKDRIQPPVENWLHSFANSSFVITDSFHACVFSILFQKQFAVIGNQDRGMARIQSLLNMFGLEERLISNIKDYKALTEIDYKKVNGLLTLQREKAMSFLKASLQ